MHTEGVAVDGHQLIEDLVDLLGELGRLELLQGDFSSSLWGMPGQRRIKARLPAR